MKNILATIALPAALALSATPAMADFRTADFGSPSLGSLSLGTDGTDPLGNMIGASFVVVGGVFHMVGVGANFDGNDNSLPGLGVQKLFVAIVPLGSGTALPSFTAGAIGANALASAAFAAPTVAGDFTIPLAINLQPGAYAAIFGSAGFLGSDSAGEEGSRTETDDRHAEHLQQFRRPVVVGVRLDTGIRIFETGAVTAVEPETFALTGLGLSRHRRAPTSPEGIGIRTDEAHTRPRSGGSLHLCAPARASKLGATLGAMLHHAWAQSMFQTAKRP
jgi:hypothetical protein